MINYSNSANYIGIGVSDVKSFKPYEPEHLLSSFITASWIAYVFGVVIYFILMN